MRSKRVASLLVAAAAGLGVLNPAPGAAAAVDIIFASDFLSGSTLQWVRRHPRAGGTTIALAPALVSAVKLTNGGAEMTLYLQVPPALNHESGYPFFSALKTFGPSNPSPPVVCCRATQATSSSFRSRSGRGERSGRGAGAADALAPFEVDSSRDVLESATFQQQPDRCALLESVLEQQPAACPQMLRRCMKYRTDRIEAIGT